MTDLELFLSLVADIIPMLLLFLMLDIDLLRMFLIPRLLFSIITVCLDFRGTL